ncbi:MAG: hypothetical protein COA86_12280 [Kangiella sp.]|nr:MAG: hypothetical protein COA86_12280 [Kangiella sp.]
MSKRPAYARIHPRLWRLAEMIKVVSIGGDAVSLALYLRSNQLINMIGVYYLPTKKIQRELSFLTEDEILELLQVLTNVGYCKYNFEEEYVWVIDMAEHQVEQNPSQNQKKGVQNIVDRLREDEAPFINDFIEKYGDSFSVSKEKPTDKDLVAMWKKDTLNTI